MIAMSTHEFYGWSPNNPDGTPRTEWAIRDAADDKLIHTVDPTTGLEVTAGPYSLDDAIKVSADLNAAWAPFLGLVEALRVKEIRP